MMDRGIWVKYGDYIGRTGATHRKNKRTYIEYIKEDQTIHRSWVISSSIEPLNEAIQDLLDSIYINLKGV